MEGNRLQPGVHNYIQMALDCRIQGCIGYKDARIQGCIGYEDTGYPQTLRSLVPADIYIYIYMIYHIL